MNELATPIESSLAAATLSLIVVLAFYMVQSKTERAAVMPVALLAWGVKAVAVPSVYFYLKAEGYQGFTYLDGFKYHEAASEMARDLRYGLPHTGYGWGFRDPGYNYIGSFLYLVFGPNTLVPRFFNVAFSSMSLLYVFRIGRITFDEKVGRTAAWMLAFLPFTMLITVDQRKDAVVQLVATFILYHTIQVLRMQSRWLGSFTAILIALFGMYYLRSGFVLPFIAVAGVCFVLGNRSIIEGLSFSFVVAVLLVALQLIVPSDSGVSIGANVERFQGKIVESTQLAEVGGLARFSRVQSLVEIYKLPLAALLVILLPFPPGFGGRSLPNLIFSWANIPTLYFLPHMVQGLVVGLRDGRWRHRLPLILYPATFMLILGMTSVGIARYRETFLPALVVLAAAGHRGGVNIVTRLAVYGALVLLALAVYFTRLS